MAKSRQTNQKKAVKQFIYSPHTIKSITEDQEENICLGFSPVAVFSASCTKGDVDLPGYAPIKFPPLIRNGSKIWYLY